MLDIEKRVKVCSASLIKEGKFATNGQVDESAISFFSGTLPLPAAEWQFWHQLRNKFYWRALSELPQILSRRQLDSTSWAGETPEHLTEEELEKLTRIMISQAFEGEAVASRVPLYSDVWEKIGKEDSPLKQFVADEDRTKAVNLGFWHTINATADSRQYSAINELERIMGYADFFRYFDFRNGTRKAQEIVLPLNFDRFSLWEDYIRWFLVQEEDILRQMGKEKANGVAGRLLAPMVASFLYGGRDWDESSENQTRALIKAFVRGEIVRHPDIQEVLGKAFEIELRDGLVGCGDYYDADKLKVYRRNLLDFKSRTLKVWRKVQDEVKQRVNVSRLGEEMREFVPAEFYQEEINGLERDLTAMSKLDVGLLSRWMHLREEDITPERRIKIRNRALKVYFSQNPRPAGDSLLSLKTLFGDFDPNPFLNRVRGYLFADLLSRGKTRAANSIFIQYERATPKSRNVFGQAVREYTQNIGKIRATPEQLKEKACYPDYNLVKDLHAKSPDLFEVRN